VDSDPIVCRASWREFHCRRTVKALIRRSSANGRSCRQKLTIGQARSSSATCTWHSTTQLGRQQQMSILCCAATGGSLPQTLCCKKCKAAACTCTISTGFAAFVRLAASATSRSMHTRTNGVEKRTAKYKCLCTEFMYLSFVGLQMVLAYSPPVCSSLCFFLSSLPPCSQLFLERMAGPPPLLGSSPRSEQLPWQLA
jgi:hypothetical protein